MSGAVLPFRPRPAGGTPPTHPMVTVQRIGHQFSATILYRQDGSERRLQVFSDPSAATRSARLLNQALAEVKP